MQVATLFRENVAIIGSSAQAAKDKISKTKVGATKTIGNTTAAVSTSEKMYNESDSDNATVAATPNSSSDYGLEDRKRKHVADVECTRTTRQQHQKEQGVNRNVMVKKIKSEQNPSTVVSTGRKFLRSAVMFAEVSNEAELDKNCKENDEDDSEVGEDNNDKYDDKDESQDDDNITSVVDKEDCDNEFVAEDSDPDENEDPLKCNSSSSIKKFDLDNDNEGEGGDDTSDIYDDADDTQDSDAGDINGGAHNVELDEDDDTESHDKEKDCPKSSTEEYKVRQKPAPSEAGEDAEYEGSNDAILYEAKEPQSNAAATNVHDGDIESNKSRGTTEVVATNAINGSENTELNKTLYIATARCDSSPMQSGQSSAVTAQPTYLNEDSANTFIDAVIERSSENKNDPVLKCMQRRKDSQDQTDNSTDNASSLGTNVGVHVQESSSNNNSGGTHTIESICRKESISASSDSCPNSCPASPNSCVRKNMECAEISTNAEAVTGYKFYQTQQPADESHFNEVVANSVCKNVGNLERTGLNDSARVERDENSGGCNAITFERSLNVADDNLTHCNSTNTHWQNHQLDVKHKVADETLCSQTPTRSAQIGEDEMQSPAEEEQHALNYNKIDQKHQENENILSVEQQEQQHRHDLQREDISDNSLIYHSYLDHDTAAKNVEYLQRREKANAATASLDATGNGQAVYHMSKDMLDNQPQNIKSELHDPGVFPSMQQQYQQQTEQQQPQTHLHSFEQDMLQASEQHLDKQQQQPHLHSHLQQHHHQQMQHFTQEQLFQFQQQQQHVHPTHNLHHVLHNQMQTQIHLQQSLLQQQHQQQHHQHRPQQLQHQRHHDEHAHLMAYLHQENQHRQQQQQLQQVYHQQQQQQQQYQEQQRMHHETLLMSSPHPLHHQQQQQIRKPHLPTTASNKKSNQLTTIDELMIDEYHEDHNVEYKLSVSPNNVKHENQDDGYETSAGDVLTPNSHTSSTHSLTPQHQIQHTVGLLPPTKCEEQQLKTHQHQISGVNSEAMHNQQQHQQQSAHNVPINATMNQEIITESATSAAADAYSFIDDELTAAANMRMMSPPNERPTPSDRAYLPTMSDGTVGPCTPTTGTLPNEGSMHLQHQQQQLLVPSVTMSTSQQQQSQEFVNNSINNAVPNGNNNTIVNFGCANSLEEQSLQDNSILLGKPPKKKRGRKKKVVAVDIMPDMLHGSDPQDLNATEETLSGTSTGGILKSKERKKHDRFNGMSEEEVAKRILPDHLCDNLDIVIVGINPGLFAAYKGHHYAGPGNHFWKCLYLSGLTHEQMSAEEDYKLLKYGIGFTNMVQRATKGSADLTRKEIKEGSRILLEKLQQFRPKIAVFNGKLIFEVFSGKKDFNFGRQPECVEGTDTYIWVMPSSSARCAQLPRAADKVPFYAALKKFRDFLNGLIPHIDESECVFTEHKIKQCCEQENMKMLPSGSNVAVGGENTGLLYGTGSSADAQNTTQQLVNESQGQGNNNNNSLMQKDAVNILMQQQHQLYNNQQQPHQHQEQNQYMYGSEENVNGPGPPHIAGLAENRYMLPSACQSGQPEKKKRGRPKKIKEIMGQEVIDPTTGNKIRVTNQMQLGNDFSNILNLSMMAGNGELPKKKRGRPKKVKLATDMTAQPQMQHRQQHQQHPQQQPDNCNAMLTSELNSASPQQHVPLFNTPPPQQQQRLYPSSSSSPMRSPAVNCSYTTVTPPAAAQSTPPIHQQLCGNSKHESKIESSDLGPPQHLVTENSNSYYTDKLVQSSSASSAASSPHQGHLQQHQMLAANASAASTDLSGDITAASNDPQMGDSPTPNSPNICAVDFDPPTATSNSSHHNLDSDMNQRQLSLHQRLHQQNSRYASPTHDVSTDEQQQTNESFHQWLSPNHQQSNSAIHYNAHQAHQQQSQQLMQYQDQHLHNLQQQHNQQPTSLHAHWQRQQQQHQQPRFEDNPSNYLMHHQNQQQQQQLIVATPEHHAHQQQPSAHHHTQPHSQISTDVASKSLSGLESLVDQIPTISESETAASNTLSATAAAAVENRLQSMQVNNSSSRQRSTNSAASEAPSELYGEPTSHTPNGGVSNDNSEVLAGGSSGSNTPHNGNSMYGGGSPGNYSMHRLNSTASAASSPISHASLRSPLYQQQSQQLLGNHQHYAPSAAARLMDLLPPSTPTSIMNNSPPTQASTSTPPLSNSVACTGSDADTGRGSVTGSSMYGNSNSSSNSTSNIHTSNFSVSHLAASSATPSPLPSLSSTGNVNSNYPPPPTNHAYHHSNLMAAAALAVAAASSPSTVAANAVSAPTHAHHVPHPQMYMDPHAHLPVPVNTMYPHHPHAHAHHHHAHAYGPPPQHSPATEYDITPYGSPNTAAAAVQSSAQTSPAHTLHMPSPNYPYGYATPPTQSGYTSAMHAHQSTPPTPPAGAVTAAAAAAAAAAAVAGYHHTHHHPHPHHHGHHASHHLSMFERLKPSDIGGYGGF